MRKLLVVAILANLGLARAAEPSASAAPRPAAAKDGEAPGRKAPPAKAGAEPAAAKAEGQPSAAKDVPPAKAAEAPPCEPVKPCSIDG